MMLFIIDALRRRRRRRQGAPSIYKELTVAEMVRQQREEDKLARMKDDPAVEEVNNPAQCIP